MLDSKTFDDAELRALQRLNEIGSDKVLSVFRKELERSKRRLVTESDMDSIRRHQGRAEAFNDLLVLVEELKTVVL